MNKLKIISLTASIVLAAIFTFSCSGDDGGEDGGSSSSTEGGGQVGGSWSSGGGGNGNSITYGNDTYPIVVIGTQTWLAKNLNYAVEGSKCYGEGGEVVIGEDENYNPITKTLSPAEVQVYCVKYGRLYDWATAMGLPSSCNENSCSSQIQPKHKGICPSGWHIPSDNDWDILMNYVGGYETAGAKLKAMSDWNENGNGTDQYGFSALPGGSGYSDDIVGAYLGIAGRWWSTNEDKDDSYYAYNRRMDYDSEIVFWNDKHKSDLYSVRCVKDN
jgi:uncharacterized protein (TIGR02145 family)